MNAAYPFFTALGSPRELGRSHGVQAKDRIRGFLDYLGASLKLPRESLRRRAERFEPLFHRHCPRLLDEVAGLAEGAEIHRLDALAAQLRGELIGASDEACTAFAIRRDRTTDGGTLIGQNSDNPPELTDYAYVLRLVPDAGPRILMWTFGGMLGYHGLNEHGVAHFANSLAGGPGWKFAISHYPLKRLILERRGLAEILRLMREVPVCSNGNYVLCDGGGRIADVELTTEGPEEVDDSDSGFLVHSNHYLCGRHARDENHALGLPDSLARLDRMRDLLQGRGERTSLDDVKRFLADHSGFPTGVCRHSHEGRDYPMLAASGRTVAAIVAEPDRGLLHVAPGNPCESAFSTYRLIG